MTFCSADTMPSDSIMADLDSSCRPILSAHDFPGSPPHNAQAIRPALGYPSSPGLQPWPCLSTSCRAKYERMRATVSEDRLRRLLISRARATPISVPPLPYSARHSRPRFASAAMASVGLYPSALSSHFAMHTAYRWSLSGTVSTLSGSLMQR